MIEHVIPFGVGEMPITQYILRAWPLASPRAVKEAVKARDVRINGEKFGQDAVVNGGDTLKIYLTDRQLGIFPAEIAFLDDDIIAAVKPVGLPVDTDRNEIGADTLLTRVCREYPEAQLAHRLDTGTGGVILLSRNGRTHEAMLAAFKEHTLEKRYLAVVKGEFAAHSGTLRAFLEKKAAASVVTVTRKQTAASKPIETRFAVVNANKVYSVIEAEPVTGRTHQLRAHFAAEGHPILGDDKYGDREFNRKFKKNTPMLWCRSIRFVNAPGLEKYKTILFEAKPQGFEDYL